jgi:hypothetical protein
MRLSRFLTIPASWRGVLQEWLPTVGISHPFGADCRYLGHAGLPSVIRQPQTSAIQCL